MSKFFQELEQKILKHAAIDYLSIADIYSETLGDHMLMKDIPSKAEFKLMLELITYLYKKYSNYLVCLEGPDMKPINKNPEELVKWLQEEYDKGKYNLNIDYGVWFDLDKAVIPKKYLPPYPTK